MRDLEYQGTQREEEEEEAEGKYERHKQARKKRWPVWNLNHTYSTIQQQLVERS